MRAQRRAIGGQVVRDVLAEERPARLASRILFGVTAVAEATGGTQLVQQPFGDVQLHQLEHPPVAATVGDRRVDALRCEAVVANDVGRRHRPTLPEPTLVAEAQRRAKSVADGR